jgi:hypothetical protein
VGRRSTDQDGHSEKNPRNRSIGCAGACLLAFLGLSIGYFVLAKSGTWISIIAGILIMGFTGFLIWTALRQGD